MNKRYKKRNRHADFDEHINERLRNYVYGLFDPRNDLPFYVGKGGGKGQQGNQRVLDHFREAHEKSEAGADSISNKIKRIHEIWDCEQDVEWQILAHGIDDEKVALRIETALIDMLNACSNIELTNIQAGQNSRLLSSDAVYELASQQFDPALCPEWLREKPIFLFNTSKALTEGKNKEAATRSAWKVKEDWRKKTGGVALGLKNGISHTAIRVDGWEKANDTSKRWQIIGPVLSDIDTQSLAPRNFAKIIESCKGFWQRGGYLIIEVSRVGQSFAIVRGKAKSDRDKENPNHDSIS